MFWFDISQPASCRASLPNQCVLSSTRWDQALLSGSMNPALEAATATIHPTDSDHWRMQRQQNYAGGRKVGDYLLAPSVKTVSRKQSALNLTRVDYGEG
jgi:hypothetical protein